MSGNSLRTLLVKSLFVFALLALIAPPALAASFGGTGVFPPNSHPYGHTFNYWAGEWWKYTLSFPADINPINDPTGANCGLEQSGQVFFLMGTAGGSVVRDDCVVLAGKALFFPLQNWLGAVPEDGATSEEVAALVTWAANFTDEVYLIVDGVPLSDPFDYRFSQAFSFTGAIDNPYDTACGTPGTCYEGYHEFGFTDGYYVMLHPLSVGEHTLQFGGHFYIPDWDWEGSYDITYNLTVAPRSVTTH